MLPIGPRLKSKSLELSHLGVRPKLEGGIIHSSGGGVEVECREWGQWRRLQKEQKSEEDSEKYPEFHLLWAMETAGTKVWRQRETNIV